MLLSEALGLPSGLRQKNYLQCREPALILGLGKALEKKMATISAFSPGESNGQRRLSPGLTTMQIQRVRSTTSGASNPNIRRGVVTCTPSYFGIGI